VAVMVIAADESPFFIATLNFVYLEITLALSASQDLQADLPGGTECLISKLRCRLRLGRKFNDLGS
jgi:hypothetical protein